MTASPGPGSAGAVTTRLDEVTGQGPASESLRRAVAHDEVGHAFLLVGPEGVGQDALVRQLGAALNCEAPVDGRACTECGACVRVARGTHPNVVTHRPAGAFHLVEPVRQVWIPQASRTLTEGRRRVIHIVAVDRMNEAAQNAFLKALEEPPPSTVWVLDAQSTGPLLDTIISRCRRLDLRAWGARDLQTRAIELGLDDPERARVLARAAQGSPTRLAEFVADLWQWTCPSCDEVTRLHGVPQPAWPTHCAKSSCADDEHGPPPLVQTLVEVTARQRHLAVVERFRSEGAAAVGRIAKEVADWAGQRADALGGRHEAEFEALQAASGVDRSRDLEARFRNELKARHKREVRQARLEAVTTFLDDFGSYLRDLVAVASGADPADLVNVDIHDRLRADAQVVDVAVALRALAELPEVREAVIVHSAQPQLQLERLLMPVFVGVFAAQQHG